MKRERKHKSKDAFWRACRHLRPHRRLVAISVCCALIVGIAFTGGLGTILPIMQVLVNGDTLQDWVNRRIVEKRLDVRLPQEGREVRPVRIDPGGAADVAGLKVGQALWIEGQVAVEGAGSAVLRLLADPQRTSAPVVVEAARAVDLPLKPVPGYLVFGHNVARALPTNPIGSIAIILGVLVFLALFGNVVRFFQQYLAERSAVLAVRDIRVQLYDHALHMPLAFFGQRGTSDITSRLTQDAHSLQEGMKSIIAHCVQDAIKAAFALSLALFVSWQLTLFILGFGPVMFLLIRRFGKHIRRAARKAMQNASTLLGQIESSLVGIRVVKSANAQRFERRRFRGIAEALMGEQLRIARMEAINTPILELLTLIVVCGIVLYASYLVLVTRTLSPGTFFLVMACLMGIGESLRRISKINIVLQKSNAAAARLFELIDLPAESPRPLLASAPSGNGHPAPAATLHERPRIILPPIQRDIRFESVTFTYPGASAPAVRDVSLTVRKGQSIAIVGRNGSGKTTLLALLPRFYTPQSGRILIDGIDISAVSLTSLRRQIGIVTQDSIIFPGTIADNIAYANPRVTRDQVIAAARRAFAHDFILDKPRGYDTPLGEHGAQLSGGQKQRLCIARAILRQTPILILDEATSQVDAESEHLIQQAIESLMHERTTFVIAHRFSTILSADLIVVMDRAQIVGSGSHDDLLRTCATYQQLYERQLIGAGASPV